MLLLRVPGHALFGAVGGCRRSTDVCYTVRRFGDCAKTEVLSSFAQILKKQKIRVAR